MNYLFLAIPNFCGSTLTHNLLATCPEVASLTDIRPNAPKGIVEGNVCANEGYVPIDVSRSLEALSATAFNDPSKYDWLLIKSKWDANWIESKPNATIRMQKTPSDIFRVQLMVEYFPDLKWIVSVKNPYAYVASLIKRFEKYGNIQARLEHICHHVTTTMQVQLDNKSFLDKDAYVMTYEDFIARPDFHTTALGEFLPGLEKINCDGSLWIKGEEITLTEDNGPASVHAMSIRYPGIINDINTKFKLHQNILEAWGYTLRKP
jgi:hypothetical protein